MKRSSLLSGPAALIVLLAFFMPWVTVKCSGDEVETSSGYEIATGSSDLSNSNDYNDPEVNESDRYLWLIPAAALGVGIATLLRYGYLIGHTPAAVIYGLASLLALFAHLAEYLDIQDGIKDAEKQVGSGIITVDYKIGWWLSLLGLLAILVAAYLAYSETDDQPARPVSPPSNF